MIKIIQYGVGALGSTIVKKIMNKKGMQIVGALDIAEDKVGKDLGEALNIGKLGITISNDPEKLFSEVNADIVCHTVGSDLEESYNQIMKPVQEGMNVISAAENLGDPYALNPDLAAKLDKLAKKNGVTVISFGLFPGLIENIVFALTAASNNIKSIKIIRYFSMTAYGDRVRKHFSVGDSPEEFEKKLKEGKIPVKPGARSTIKIISDRMRWKIDQIKDSCEPIIAENVVIGGKMISQALINNKEVICVEITGCNSSDYESYYLISIEDEKNDGVEAKIRVDGVNGTTNMIMHAIPYIVKAKPGLLTLLDIPVPFF